MMSGKNDRMQRYGRKLNGTIDKNVCLKQKCGMNLVI